MQNPIVFHAKMMGDIMYYHQALQQPDAKQFAGAVVKEVNGHVDNKHWELVKQEEAPEDVQVVPSVWSMRRKRNLTTNKITKHINVCYHHFCEHVQKGLIKIFPVDTKDQIADAPTKPLAQNNFQRHCHFMCGKEPPQATKVRECCVLGTLVLIFR